MLSLRRFRSRLTILVIIGLTLIWLWYYFARRGKTEEMDNKQTILETLDVGDYDPGMALAFFSIIDSPEHRNCRLFRRRFPYKRNQDGDIDIAFTVTVNSDVRPLSRLLRMIYRVNNYYCIHIDKMADPELEMALRGLITCFGGNIELVPKESRVALARGDESLLQSQLTCAKQALLHSRKWIYLINIADQDFPLRTNLEMVAILKALNGSNLVESFPVDRFKSRTKGKKLPLQATWYKGTIYGVYRRDFLQEAILGQAVAPIRDLLLEHEAVVSPDEFFFPVLAYNSRLKLPGACLVAPLPAAEANLGFLAKFAIWGDYGVKCDTKFHRYLCVLGNAQLPMLRTAPHLFATKFEPDFEPEAYTDLEQWYFERIEAEMKKNLPSKPPFDATVYASRSCSKNHL